MNWNEHWNLKDKHAFLGASQHSWLNYTPEKLRTVYFNRLAKETGTKLHALASMLIKMHVRLPQSKKTLNMFVNDAIGYRMQSEQILYFSDNCFGTADAISYKDHNRKLRVHDLKTGSIPASMAQLRIYAALFCLEYHIDPNDISTELRIYQNDEIVVEEPDPGDIVEIVNKIIQFDKLLNEMKREDI